MDEVDMIVHALQDQRSLRADVEFMCGLRQRRTIGRVSVGPLDEHTAMRQRENLHRGDLREQRLALRPHDGDDGVLLLLVVQNDKIGAAVLPTAPQLGGECLLRSWAWVRFYAGRSSRK